MQFYSWGTKGDNSISKDLGVVKVAEKDKGVKTVEVEVPVEDINTKYEEALSSIGEKSTHHEVK